VLPIELFQSNLVFILGMTINGILFSTLLGFDLMNLKVTAAVTEERNRELKELDSAKSELMMNVSHEFRTPITIIGGITTQMKEGKWGDSISANRKNLEVIERNNLRLHKQVDGLLQLATMEKRRDTVNPEAIDLSATVHALTGEFMSLAELKRISMAASVPEDLRLVADVGLFRTAMVNLLGNAVKYTPLGGTVRIDVFRSESEIRIAVSDTGPGIPELEQPRVFHRFYRLRTPGDTPMGGTGIGLSLVKAVMERHNGRVELESSPGTGATFTLVFPSASSSTLSCSDALRSTESDLMIKGHRAEILGEVSMEDSLETSKTRDADQTEPVVLVVEDDRELREFLDRELGAHFAVVHAGHGGEALEQMGSHTPDLVISDVMMPEMDGYQLLAAMQEDDRLRLIPTIFLTARDAEEERISAFAEGVVDYIGKPFSPGMLIARARNIIETHAAFKAGYQLPAQL